MLCVQVDVALSKAPVTIADLLVTRSSDDSHWQRLCLSQPYSAEVRQLAVHVRACVCAYVWAS